MILHNIIMDNAKIIFNNIVSNKDYKSALRAKNKMLKKYKDDKDNIYHLKLVHNPILDEIGCLNLVEGETPLQINIEKPLIVGNIRMGFGHYRISMAIASCASAMGYTPIWFDLNSFKQTTGGKIIGYQNDLYSFGSRLSQKSKLFNRYYWEPLNYEGFRKLKQNAKDQKMAELMTPIFHDIDRNIPYVATHVWPSQAAVLAGMKDVVNAIPDNWQMALHLSQGSIHTVQTYNAYWGYKNLRGMDRQTLKPMSSKELYYVGHYVDHELLKELDQDCNMRQKRIKENKPLRILLTVGGAGSQIDLYANIITHLYPKVLNQEITLFINVGDHEQVLKQLFEKVPHLKSSTLYKNRFNDIKKLVDDIYQKDCFGSHIFYDEDIFSAVYSTNILMRVSDLLITKPSELAFYPIPKLFIQRVGGHERWGAIHSAEIGDGTYECETLSETIQMLDSLLVEPELLHNMNNQIISNNKMGIYNGGYRVIELATKNKIPN